MQPSDPCRGFSIRELLVIVAVLVGLSGFLAPVAMRGAPGDAEGRAAADLNRIASALNLYIRDTLYYPTGPRGATAFHFLHGEGAIPSANRFASGPGAFLAEVLDTGSYGGPRWSGPYLQPVGADPWGQAYLVNCHGYFCDGERVLLLSAGPDGRVDTPPRPRRRTATTSSWRWIPSCQLGRIEPRNVARNSIPC